MADAKPSPVPMLLWCPFCSERHIDTGEFATKPHHTHACQSCGGCWRPAIVPTCGVQFLSGFKDVKPEDKGVSRSVKDALHCLSLNDPEMAEAHLQTALAFMRGENPVRNLAQLELNELRDQLEHLLSCWRSRASIVRPDPPSEDEINRCADELGKALGFNPSGGSETDD